MFLTFWLRTKTEYSSTKTDLTKLELFTNELKTSYMPNEDSLISANRFGWYKTDKNQRHGVVCESSILAREFSEMCNVER